MYAAGLRVRILLFAPVSASSGTRLSPAIHHLRRGSPIKKSSTDLLPNNRWELTACFLPKSFPTSDNNISRCV